MATLCLLLPLVLLADPEPTAAPDLSSPLSALRAYYTAVDGGDLKRLESMCLANKVQKEWIKSQVEMVQSLNRYSEVGAKKFGDDGKVFQQHSSLRQALERLEKIEIETDGDRSIAKYNPKVPLQLSRGPDGRWLVDYESTLAGKDTEISYAAKVFRETAKLMNGLADDVEAGKFATVSEVQQALRERRKAMDAKLVSEKPASIP